MFDAYWGGNQHDKAITALREALAEQPAQQALDKMAENARELGLDYEPAQQEPVAAECKFEGFGTWGRCSVEHHNLVQSEPHKWPDYKTRLLYTSPPAQRTWQGLTDEEVINVMPDDDTPMSLGEAFSKFAELIEAKLKEKNT